MSRRRRSSKALRLLRRPATNNAGVEELTMNRFGSCLRIAVGLLLIGGAAQPAAAQATLQNATIFGTVTDESGSALPGALVEVSSPSLQAVQAATANGE